MATKKSDPSQAVQDSLNEIEGAINDQLREIGQTASLNRAAAALKLLRTQISTLPSAPQEPVSPPKKGSKAAAGTPASARESQK